MRIKKQKEKSSFLLFCCLTILVVFLGTVSIAFSNDKRIEENPSKKSRKGDEINVATKIENNASIQRIVKDRIGLLRSDSICSIYATSFQGTPNLIYVYKSGIKGRALTDKIFVHLFLKDRSKLPKGQSYVNIGIDFFPKEFEFNGESYIYSRVGLVHESLKLDNVKFINTGRYLSGSPKSYDAQKLKLNLDNFSKTSNSYSTLIVKLKAKNFIKISAKRNRAIKERVLMTSDNDLVPAEIYMQDDSAPPMKIQMRLKGDWVDHLRDSKKWSFRIKMKGEDTMFGMRKFSIQHPKTRHFLWEWLFHKVIKDNDIIGLRYDFLNTTIKIESKGSSRDINLGIMAMEESFDKILIENNKKREGIILSFNESYMWKERNKAYVLNLPNNTWEREEDEPKIRVFNENKVLSTPKLLNQFNTAKGLIYELKKGNLLISEVFDIDKLTFFVALSNLFGGRHGLAWHNIRFYYNPITNKLEPISFDANAGLKIDKIDHYVFSEKDPLYQKKLIENLTLVSSQEFIQNVINRYSEELENQLIQLGTEFNFNLDFSILEYNSNFIKKQLSPSTTIISSLKSLHGNEMIVEVKNLSNSFPVSIVGLKKTKGRILSKNAQNIIVAPGETKEVKIPLKDSFINAFVSKKNKKGVFRFPNDLEKIKIVHNLQWANQKFYGDIIPFVEFDPTFLKEFRNTQKMTHHEFVLVDETNKTIMIKKGNFSITNDIILPPNYLVKVEAGFNLNLLQGASFISYSTIICEGNKDDLIKIFSSDSTGKGVFVTGTKSKSVLNYCQFTNLSNPSNDLWELSGAVNFHEADVIIKNSTFEKNRCEDGLNIIRSSFSMVNSTFKETFSDAFDGDFVKGSIRNSLFINSGNDGIDVSGSKLEIQNVKITNSSDKAISAGEGSTIFGKSVSIFNGEIGVVSKDLSTVSLNDVTIIGTRLGFSAFQKKSEFGPGTIIVNDLKLRENELNYLVENKSKLILNNELVKTVSNKVIDKMYGKEYGKSSR